MSTRVLFPLFGKSRSDVRSGFSLQVKHLGQTLAQMQPTLHKLVRRAITRSDYNYLTDNTCDRTQCTTYMFAAKAASTRLSRSTARSSSGASSCEWSQSSGRSSVPMEAEDVFVLLGTKLPPSSRTLRRSVPSPTSTSTPFRSRPTRNPMYRSTRALSSYKLVFRVPSTWACRRCRTMKLRSGKKPRG